jgi:methionine-S-sulfoxide reductase
VKAEAEIIMEKTTQKATFAAGCFWGVEATFRQVKGVVATAVGYEGGSFSNPSYHDVCTDRTGHAEAVEVDYDPARVSYEDLLAVFWANHDPTTLDRQGPDFGSQYRSVAGRIAAGTEEPNRRPNESLKNTHTSCDGTGRHDCDGAASVIANTTTSAATAASRRATQHPPGGERCGSWCCIWSRRERHWRGRDDCRTHWQCASLQQCVSPSQTPQNREV